MPQFYTANGIVHQVSCIETPEKNRVVERKQSASSQCCSVIHVSIFLAHVILELLYFTCYLYLINITPRPILQNKSLCVLLFGSLPNYDLLQVFCCLVFSYISPIVPSLILRGELMFSLDILWVLKGFFFLIFFLDLNILSRHVTFFETLFTMQLSFTSSLSSTSPSDSIPLPSHNNEHLYDSDNYSLPSSNSSSHPSSARQSTR